MALVPIERQVNVATVAARLRQQMGLKDAATKEASEFATAAEGALATTALQPESPLAAENLTGTIDLACIPVMPGNEQIVSSAGIAALTTEQQAVVLRGSIVTTTDGRRWVYTGSGSKVSEASYIVLADVTPDWSAVSGKPTFGDAAAKNTGTTAGTVAAGDDSRIVGALQPSTGLYRVATFANANTDYIPASVTTVYVEDRAARFVDVGSEPSHPFKFQNAGRWFALDEYEIFPQMVGLLGDGSDETALLQAVSDYAVGRKISLKRGAIYGVTSLILKAGTKITTNDAVFRKMAASTSYAVTVQDDVVYDNIITSSPGGGPDRGIRVIGNRVRGGLLKATADVPVDGFGVRIEGTALQSISGLNIGKISTKNFSSQTQVFYVEDLFIGKSIVDTYVTGIYLINVLNSHIEEVYASGIHPSATGGPGNNGVLIESASDYGTDNLTLGDVTLKDSCEHSLRIGGSYMMRSVYVRSLKSFNSGALAGVSTGSAAFKALLNHSNPGRHQDIRVESLYFEDCGTTGTGFGNHSAINIGRCQDVVIMNPVGRKRNKAFSCIQAMTVNGCSRVKIINPDIRDCNFVICDFGVNPDPAPLEGLTDVIVDGGILHTLGASLSVSMHGSTGVTSVLDAPFNNVSFVNKVKIMGGSTSVRYQDVTAGGSYANMVMDIEYTAPNATPSGGVWQAVATSLETSLTVRLITDIATPASSRARNGSTWISTGDNAFKIRKAGSWATL